eukprot:6803747-Pyramimonas_sp.AAC.1
MVSPPRRTSTLLGTRLISKLPNTPGCLLSAASVSTTSSKLQALSLDGSVCVGRRWPLSTVNT